MIIIKIIVIIVVSLLAGWIMGTIEYFTQSPDAGVRFAFAIIVAYLLYMIMRKDKQAFQFIGELFMMDDSLFCCSDKQKIFKRLSI